MSTPGCQRGGAQGAGDPGGGGIGGRYFADCNEAETLDRRGAPLQGVARYALDPEGARRLWALSQELLDA